MSDKPIIRHCRNCKFANLNKFTDSIVCDVKYKYYLQESQRVTAIFCKYYKQKEENQTLKIAMEKLAKSFEEFEKNIGGKNK